MVNGDCGQFLTVPLCPLSLSLPQEQGPSHGQTCSLPQTSPSWVYTVVFSLGKVSSNMEATVCFCMGSPWPAASFSEHPPAAPWGPPQAAVSISARFLLHGKSLFQAQEHLLPLLLLQTLESAELLSSYVFSLLYLPVATQYISPFHSTFPQGAHPWLHRASCVLHGAAPAIPHRGAMQAPLSALCHGSPIHHSYILYWNQRPSYIKIIKVRGIILFHLLTYLQEYISKECEV